MNHPDRPSRFTPAVCALLPPEARQALVRAAQEAKRITDDLAREIYLTESIAKVRMNYPAYFKD